MPRNPLTSQRKQDRLFERDKAKENKAKGNQLPFDKKRFRKKTLIYFLVGLILGFILSAMVLGMLHLLASALFRNMEFLNIFGMTISKSYKEAIIHAATTKPMLFFTLFGSFIFGVMGMIFHKKYGKRVALTEDHTDINAYVGDRDKLTLEEMFQQYEIFPDAGAKSLSVAPTAIVGHAFIDNDMRFNKVKLAKRDKNGEIEYGDDGKPKLQSLKLFDSEIQKDSFESIGIMEKEDQIKIDAFKMKYRKKENGKWQSVGDFIKEDWFIPEYEMQRPAGVFFVETAPVNSVAIAITRGNKGQTFVNHTIDMFSREIELQNKFINDPKGELFAAFHKLLELRGYEPIVLNLLDPSKTHQFNVLGPAVSMARIGDFDKMRDLLNTIMNTFFPIQGDDPFWGQAQQALVKMIIFSMIDYYLEEEKAYINKWTGKRDESTIGRDLDEMWGKVTMFNVYQMLTTMSRKEVVFCEKAIKLGESLTKEELQKVKTGVKVVNEKGKEELVPFTSKQGNVYMPNDVEQLTELTAFFRLMTLLPENKMRTITLQQSDAMNLMAESEKTRATVYGIALVAMLFFTNGPITALTSASPRQSLDPLSLAFPRRLRFKINNAFLKMHKLNGRKVRFEAFRDKAMNDQIVGENKDDFTHETKLDTLGWVEFRFKGIFEEYEYIDEGDGTTTKVPKPIYIRMKIIDDKTGYSMYTYNFEFMRGYAKTVDGKRFVHNPRTNQRIEQGGTLRIGEINDKGEFERKQKMEKLMDGMEVLPVEQTDAVYNIRPKAIFSITPPHLADYIKVVIVMVSVLFDTSVGESYITKASGKPFYKTRSILDELGNMQFDGNGIPNFQTKLSIGLGQGQEYTMILQTLQQLRDVYGDSVDKIVSSNTAVFMYLISNDTGMLEELSKQAGTKHVSRAQQKTVGKTVGSMVDTFDDNVSYQYGTEEEPLFSVNELMSFTNGESMVLSTVHRKDNSGGSVRPNPIHNTRETLMPMAYALHQKGHNSPVFKRALQNAEVATSSTDRDVYQDIPNFTKLLDRRMEQATRTPSVTKRYMEKNNLTEDDLINKDKDEMSESIMRMVNLEIDIANTGKIKEEDLSHVNDQEKEILTDEEKVDKFDISSSEYQVDESEHIYQGEIQEARETEQKKHDEENSLVYLDQNVSLSHLKQTGLIQTLLGQALYESKLNPNKINTNIYDFELEGNMKRIYFKDSDILVAEYEINIDDDGEQASAWHVTTEFIDAVIKRASKGRVKFSENASEDLVNVTTVDELFEFDNNNIVKQKFIDLFKAEEGES